MRKRKTKKDKDIPIIAWIAIIISGSIAFGLFTLAFLIKFGAL